MYIYKKKATISRISPEALDLPLQFRLMPDNQFQLINLSQDLMNSDCVYFTALQEFERLSDFSDVYDKLNCLILVRHYIVDCIIAYWKARNRLRDLDLSLTTDDLVLIISYIITRSQVQNLFAELNFIDDFIDENQLNGEAGYCMVSLQTSLNFLINFEAKTQNPKTTV